MLEACFFFCGDKQQFRKNKKRGAGCTGGGTKQKLWFQNDTPFAPQILVSACPVHRHARAPRPLALSEGYGFNLQRRNSRRPLDLPPQRWFRTGFTLLTAVLHTTTTTQQASVPSGFRDSSILGVDLHTINNIAPRYTTTAHPGVGTASSKPQQAGAPNLNDDTVQVLKYERNDNTHTY